MKKYRVKKDFGRFIKDDKAFHSGKQERGVWVAHSGVSTKLFYKGDIFNYADVRRYEILGSVELIQTKEQLENRKRELENLKELLEWKIKDYKREVDLYINKIYGGDTTYKIRGFVSLDKYVANTTKKLDSYRLQIKNLERNIGEQNEN